MKRTQSGGISFTKNDALPDEKAGSAHEAKLLRTQTKEQQSLKDRPTDPEPPRNSAADSAKRK